MTGTTAETSSTHLFASQYGLNVVVRRLRAALRATTRAAVFARQCEHHFNRYGQISPQAMVQIAARTRLSRAG
ncbi:MAG TPA: hypothetical protein VKN63_02235 [Afifellaceae bacterium]|nr:hypothetical protein [Afifellaceae bacterium]